MRSKPFLGLLLLIIIVGFVGCSGCSVKNGLVTLDEEVSEQWANVESQYQRRADLIPNLVVTARSAADFEQDLIDGLTEAADAARAISDELDDAGSADQLGRFLDAQDLLSQRLRDLMGEAGSKPSLRAMEAFRDLQAQLEGTENRINVARRDYNESVSKYNTKLRRFPSSIFAGILGFDTKAPFESNASGEKPPAVGL